MSHSISSLARIAGTTDATIAGLIRSGFIAPCGFWIDCQSRWTTDAVEALAFEAILGLDFEPLIPDHTAGMFLALLPTPPPPPEKQPMLVLKRKEGQWVEITHAKSGEKIRIRVCRIEPGQPGHLNLAFEDDARNFEIERPERHRNHDASPRWAADAGKVA